ncbi:MAG TPA: Crp/Fnr family transcriptional regulator [Firmicutes bacterium]|nr:Crp/Fnr family transcriptional regulator [Bacillota bacterium]
MIDPQFLKQVELFSEMNEDDFSRIMLVARERVYPKGATLFLEDEPGDCMFIIVKGAVKVYTLSPEGREKTIAILSRGDCLGEMAVLDGRPRSASAEAIEETRAVIITRDDFRQVLLASPRTMLKVIELLSQRLRAVDRHIEYLALKDASARLASFLLALAERHGRPLDGKGHKIDIKLTHQELASLAGISRETATRLINQFQDAGLIETSGGWLVILDFKRLSMLAG